MGSTTADYLDLKTELIAGFPPGWEDWLDVFDPDGPGPLLEGDAHVLEDAGTQKVDELRLELSPLTCAAAGLARWEQSLGLLQTKIALTGDVLRRRAQVLSRLREYGPPTKRLVQTVLNGFLNYDDASQIVLVESDRTKIRAKNQKEWNGNAPFGPGVTATLTWTVWDDPRVSKGGAQVDLNLECADLSTLVATLAAPDGTTYHWPNVNARHGDFDAGIIGVGARHAGALGLNLRLYAKAFVGQRPIYGTWTMTLTSNNPGDFVIRGVLLVEALGRYYDWLGKPRDGLAAAMYEWAAMAEETKLGTDPDILGALNAVRRLSYARSKASVVQVPLGGMLLVGIPDADQTIPDRVIPG